MAYSKEFIKALLAQRGVQRLALGGPVIGHSPVTFDSTAPTDSVPAPTPAPTNPLADTVARLQARFHSTGATPAPADPNAITATQTFDGAPNQLGFNAKIPLSTQGFNPGQYGGSVNDSQQSLGALTGALQAQAAGQGPSLAQSQLADATERNAAQAAGAIASQRGLNPALAARLIAQNQASINQQAAGQSAQSRVSEQLGAQQALGQLGLGRLGTAGRLMTDEEKMALEQAQGNQNAALHAQDTNANISLSNQAGASHMLDTGLKLGAGLLGGAAAAGAQIASSASKPQTQQTPGAQTTTDPAPATPDSGGGGVTTEGSPVDTGAPYEWTPPTYARGGLVRALRMASGGPVPSYDYSGASQVGDPRAPNLLGSGSSASGVASGGGAGGTAGGSNAEALGLKIASAIPYVGPLVGPLAQGGQALMDWDRTAPYQSRLTGRTEEGKVNQAIGNTIADARDWTVNAANDVGNWVGGLFHAGGGAIPGKAKVQGDDTKNDTVPAMLSPGEIVLPRSVTTSNDAPSKAKAFVAAIKKQKATSAPASIKSYGELLQMKRQIQERLAQLKGGK